MSNTGTKQTDLERDMAFGQVTLNRATPDQDIKEVTDYIIGDLKIAYRRRRISVKKYGQISIRDSRASGTKTEKEKILDGTSKAKLYIFEFTDAWVICRISDIRRLLLNSVAKVVRNHDGVTSAIYINISDVSHLIIYKEES